MPFALQDADIDPALPEPVCIGILRCNNANSVGCFRPISDGDGLLQSYHVQDLEINDEL